MKTVVGLFDHLEEAEGAVRELTANGFSQDEISLVANNRRDQRSMAVEADGAAADSAAVGATGGAVLGGVGGLIVGLGALAIPGFGPLIAAGPLVAALTGAAVGAGLGGMVGALSEMGVPEEEAHVYAEGVRRGGSLVIVNASRDGDWTAVDILRRHGAADIERRKDAATEPGALASNENADYRTGAMAEREPAIASSATLERPATTSRIPVSETATDDGQWDPDCRRHYESSFADSGRSFEELRPAYEYGYQASSDPRFSADDWETTEANIRQDWSTRGQGTWDDVREAVRCGWECGRKAESRPAAHVEGFTAIGNMQNPIRQSEDAASGDQFDDRSGRRI
jgi:hypothetical protein